MAHTLFAYVDIFPQWKPLNGRKCLVLSEFEKHSEFSCLKSRTVNYSVTSLMSREQSESGRQAIMDLGAWVCGEPKHYGIVLPLDTNLAKGTIVSIHIEIPDLGGF